MNTMINEKKTEELLRIRTCGRDDTRSDTFNYPYEPTDYSVIKRLCSSDLIGKKNTLIDYGSGKGRVAFYMSYEIGCTSIGVEYDERLYNRALKNLETYVKPGKVRFIHENAVKYKVPDNADRFFFFNPFSAEVLGSVLKNIVNSYNEKNREILLFFYYPSDEYISLLMREPMVEFYDEIDTVDIFPDNKELTRERIMIFGIKEY